MLNFTVWMEKNSLAGWVPDALEKNTLHRIIHW
jgi:hypothetical protein